MTQDKLTFIKYVRFTDEEGKAIEKAATEYGMTFSSIIRMLVRRAMKGKKK